ncbi:50S ribosomal protein L11 methyltransferase [Campylobacter troglodytis]|uniref:50S ribosomal protein L11 methyltransferase n=1 Tax=Campylobacter troglodytis TaxID=654363 RepID=UPI00115AE6F3|nr:50S ribosomal protein L11 methyltransferase [Campylobacter troglodytis]TQR61016.1 50S ribosomal protein L11 methyltransferase [Campylobacter troglodytis]
MENSYNELFLQLEKDYNPLLIDLVLSLGIEAVEERDEGLFIRSNEDLSQIAWALDEFSTKLSQNKNIKLNLRSTLSKKPNKNWIKEYKKGVSPLQIGDFYIHSSWQEPNPNAINVQIDPALAFGSGHHESTRSCIELLAKFANKNDELLDLGCGSGILSIIAAKLGCLVSACDTDEMAVLSTLSNANLNGVWLKELWLGSINHKISTVNQSSFKMSNFNLNSSHKLNSNKNELNTLKNPKNLSNLKEKNSAILKKTNINFSQNLGYGLIVANLVGDLILSLATELKKGIKNGGFLILSGILLKYEERIQKSFEDLKQIHKTKTNEWLSFVYRKEE